MLFSRSGLIGALLLAAAHGAGAVAEKLAPAQTMTEYRVLSEQLRQRDSVSLQAELNATERQKPLPATYAKRFGFDPGQSPSFYRSAEGRRIAEVVLSYQTPSGGWSKRTDMGSAPRRPGQAYGVEKNYIPTFDNSATSTQFWVMVNAYRGTGERRYADAAERALRLILLAQYPNGGWPQSFPLRGKYHDLITLNDRVFSDLLEIVRAAAQGAGAVDFISPALRRQARDSLKRGLQMVVDSQVVSDGRRTIWGAQLDPQTLAPAAARAFEPVGLATAESADLVLFLMQLEDPSAAIKRAIASAHDWFASNRIDGFRWGRAGHDYRELVADPQAPPLWARFCEIGSDRPVFGDRDGSVYYDIRQVSRERNQGYGWYTKHPLKVLKKFAEWRERHSP